MNEDGNETLTPSRPRRWRRALLAVVLVYLCIEAVSWIVFRVGLRVHVRQAVADIRGPDAQPMGPDRLIPHPYSLIQLKPGHTDSSGVRQVNALGWRGRETSFGRPEGFRRVVCVGGGTTYGLGVQQPAEAYPARLETVLRERAGGGPIEVLNCGIPWASSAELFGTVAFRVIHHQPDLIVMQVGLEDVNPLLADGYQIDYTHWRKSWVAPSYGRRTRRLLISPLYRLVFAGFVLPDGIDLRFQYRPDPSWDDPAVKEVPPRDPAGFRNNVENILSITVGRGIPVLLVTEWTRRPFPCVDWALTADREVLETLGRKFGVPVCRLDAEDLPADSWADDFHLTALGNERKAEIIAGEVVRHRLLPRQPGAASRPAP